MIFELVINVYQYLAAMLAEEANVRRTFLADCKMPAVIM